MLYLLTAVATLASTLSLASASYPYGSEAAYGLYRRNNQPLSAASGGQSLGHSSSKVGGAGGCAKQCSNVLKYGELVKETLLQPQARREVEEYLTSMGRKPLPPKLHAALGEIKRLDPMKKKASGGLPATAAHHEISASPFAAGVPKQRLDKREATTAGAGPMGIRATIYTRLAHLLQRAVEPAVAAMAKRLVARLPSVEKFEARNTKRHQQCLEHCPTKGA